ncbi:MAG: FHA domain-containing protein [Pseudomonadota bacterium]
METTVVGAERSGQSSPRPEVAAAGRRLLSDLGAFSIALGRQVSEALRPRRQSVLMLNYGEHVLRFPTHHEFDFALSTRIEPPAQRIAELEQLTLFELRRMATDIRKLENRFSDVLAAALERGRSLRKLMVQLDLKSFSNDHDWRSIFAALAASDDDGHDPYRQVALAKYMQYLRNRQAVIQHIYAARGSEQDRQEPAPAEAVANAPLNETAIFDFTQIEIGGETAQDLWLLPRGESIGVTLAGVEHVDVMLATYGFRLVPQADAVYLVDAEGGTEYRLLRGRNAVGRGQGCDVLVDHGYREISRKHLIIDCVDEFTAVLTDLSSHGTRVPASRVIGARPTEPEALEMTMVGVGPGTSH